MTQAGSAWAHWNTSADVWYKRVASDPKNRPSPTLQLCDLAQMMWFFCFITCAMRLKSEQFLLFIIHVMNAPGCWCPALPGFCLLVPSLLGSPGEDLGLFQTPSISSSRTCSLPFGQEWTVPRCPHSQPVERPLRTGVFLLRPQTLDPPVPADPEEGRERSLNLLSATFPSPHGLLGPVPPDAHMFPLFRNQQKKKDLPLILVLLIAMSFMFFVVS